MTPVDVSSLNGLPAPYWFIQLFKVLGFVFHSVPMHLWLAGLPIGLFLLLIGGVNAKRFARRLLKQMPIIMAFGVNLGIVPLLFIQVAYYKVFYPATILMAWHWLGIGLLVLPAYYLLYITSGLVDAGHKWRPILTGTLASVFLVGAGLIFAGAWSLMAAPDAWPELWRSKSTAAAATGLASNWRDPVVFLRIVSIFGLAILTVTFWALFDAWFLFAAKKGGKKNSDGASAESGAKTTAIPYSFSPQKSKPSQSSIKDFMDNPYLSAKRKKKLSKLRDAGRLSEEDELAAMEYGFNGEAVSDTEAEEKPVQRGKKPSRSAADASDADVYRRWVLNFTSSLVWFGVFIAIGSLWFYYYKVLDSGSLPAAHSAAHSAADANDVSTLNTPVPLPESPSSDLTPNNLTPDDGGNLTLSERPDGKLFPAWLPIAAFTSIGLFAVVLTIGWFGKFRGKLLVVLLGLFEILTLAFFAATRQMIQNGQIKSYLDVKSIPVQTEWSPLLVFLAVFLLGAVLIVWMIYAMAKTARR